MHNLSKVVDWLVCPICGASFQLTDTALHCEKRHCFDIAKQGYVNLLGKATPKNADTAAMVLAREKFLATDKYLPIAEAISPYLADLKNLLEVGAGSGYYLSNLLVQNPKAVGLATDVSVPAAKRLAKVHPQMAAVVADTWTKLPVSDNIISGLLCVFAPRNPAEFFRILAPGGTLVIVTPNQKHLADIRSEYGLLDIHREKTVQLLRSFKAFEQLASEQLSYRRQLTSQQLTDLINMGPNAFHNPAMVLDSATITVDVQLWVFRKPVG